MEDSSKKRDETRSYQRTLNKKLKSLVDFLYEGRTHFFVFILVGAITLAWAKFTINSSKEVMHNLSLDFSFIPADGGVGDTVYTFSLDFVINSKEVSDSTNGSYKSKMHVCFATDADNVERRDTAIIAFSANFTADDLRIEQDSIWFEPVRNEIEQKDGSIIIKDSYIPHVYQTNLQKEIIQDSEGVKAKIKLVQAKNFLPPLGGLIEGRQQVDFYSNSFGVDEDCPYYNYYINIPSMPLAENTSHASGFHNISFRFGDVDSLSGDYFFNKNENYLFHNVYPEPDFLTNGFVFYYTKEKIEAVIKNRGIIIQAENIDAKNRNTAKSIIYSVLVGTGFAFLLDIIIQLIRDLRVFTRRSEEKKE